MKHDTETNSDMLNPISMFICPIFQPEIPFFAYFDHKIKVVYINYYGV